VGVGSDLRGRSRAGGRSRIAKRVALALLLALLAAVWALAAYLLWRTTVPSGLDLPAVDPKSIFSPEDLRRAIHYDRFVRWDFLANQVVLIAGLAVYAAYGARFVRESAAGRIGTGMLLAMLGLGLLWVVQLPFGLAELWWQRRYDVSHTPYGEWVIDNWLALGSEFLFISFAILIVMGLAGPLRDWWWIPGGFVFVGLALLLTFLFPYLLPGQRPLRDEALVAQAKAYERQLGVGDIPVRVQDVGTETTMPNAEAVGLGPTRRVILWETIVRPPFTFDQQRIVVAHELGHHARKHLWKGIAWYALFAFPGAFIIARVTRRRGGMREPEAVPLSLLVLTVLSFLALPVENVITRHIESEADWVALQLTRDPGSAEAAFKNFTVAALADPNPPLWDYVLIENHPTVVQRIGMAEAWRARHNAGG
jgi:STE24 endopeptidase